jgi:hypothetical protein
MVRKTTIADHGRQKHVPLSPSAETSGTQHRYSNLLTSSASSNCVHLRATKVAHGGARFRATMALGLTNQNLCSKLLPCRC